MEGLDDDARRIDILCLIMRSAGRGDAGRFGIVIMITLLYTAILLLQLNIITKVENPIIFPR